MLDGIRSRTGVLGRLTVVALTWAVSAPAGVAPLTHLAVSQVQPAPPPPIRWADLERARALLAQAQQQLQPQQYELLKRELVQAEGAWQRYSTLARTSGQAAEVARGTEAISAAQRAARLTERLGTLTRAGPLLVALALLWPSSTAGPNEDPPPWQRARWDLEAKLQKVSAASGQVRDEIDTSQKKAADTPRPTRKRPISLEDETTCIWVGTGGGGRPVICRYNCDGVDETIEITLPESMVQCPGELSNPLKWRQIKRYPQRL